MTHGNQKEAEIDARLSIEEEAVEEAYGTALEALRQALECGTQYEEKAAEAYGIALYRWGEAIEVWEERAKCIRLTIEGDKVTPTDSPFAAEEAWGEAHLRTKRSCRSWKQARTTRQALQVTYFTNLATRATSSRQEAYIAAADAAQEESEEVLLSPTEEDAKKAWAEEKARRQAKETN